MNEFKYLNRFGFNIQISNWGSYYFINFTVPAIITLESIKFSFLQFTVWMCDISAPFAVLNSTICTDVCQS